MYDAVQIEEEVWGFKTLKKAGVEIREEMFGTISDVINDVINDKSRHALLDEVRSEAWMYPGEAGKRIADYMMEKTK